MRLGGRVRKLAAIGFVFVALMQLVFLVTAGDRPFPYREVQVVSLVGTLVLVWGAWTGRDVGLAVGFGVNLFTRVLQPILGITRLPLWTTAILAIGWAWATVQAARGRSPAVGFWILGVGYALAMLTVFSRFGAAMALGLSAVGFFLAAPNVRH